ncbi:MAG: peptidoglycan DD-metalloendopeptidase family protein [Solobacterium sp.]|nr:peptidoglycan DD-metalloendopeptidase family protein [Solobacterium sp.]
MKRKLIAFLTALTLTVCIVPAYPVKAEEDYTNTDYWTQMCTSGQALTDAEKSACAGYMQYIAGQTDSLREQLQEIENRRAEISANISYYAEQVRGYQAQADALNGEIATLNGQIAVLEKEIQEAEEQIAKKEAEIDAVQDKIKDRMVTAQSTMRLNQYLDILMGARTFDDFIRIANGISDITAYDEKTMTDLADDIEELNRTKAKLEEDKVKLDEAKQEVVDKQNTILALKYEVQLVEQELRNQFAELEAQGNRIAGDIEAIQETMREITEQLNQIAGTSGWTYPVAGGRYSAGTWHYSSGGVHLGMDIAAAKGSTVMAVGNGVIIKSADGCGDGYLGNWCAGSPGGSLGGGNQVYLLTKINGGLYAVKYVHLLAGSPVAKGTIVLAGDYVGQVGTSGNSTGPHCHIEVFYLGSADNFTNYAQNWNGDLAFGCGWGSAGLNRLCENGAGAPCRVKPESLFGNG